MVKTKLPKKLKRTTIPKAKKKAWEAFSKFIRMRDALKTTGGTTHLKCISCGKTYPAFGKGCAQAGHFIPGRKNAVLFDEKFVNGQCYNCNVNLRGNWVLYEKKMVETHGLKAVNEVKLRANQVIQYKVEDFLEIEARYEQKFNDLQRT